jgi:hypothetical protein
MRNVLFVSHDSIIYKDNAFLITYWVGDLIFAIPCLISCIVTWKGLKRKWMKVFSLITAIIYETLFLIGTVMLCWSAVQFNCWNWEIIIVIVVLLINTCVVIGLAKHKKLMKNGKRNE